MSKILFFLFGLIFISILFTVYANFDKIINSGNPGVNLLIYMIIGIIAWVFTYLFFKFAFKSKQSNEDSESTFFFELGKMLNSSEGECNGTSFVFALLFISISVIFYYDLTEDWIEIYKTSFWGVYVVILLITVTLSIVYLNVGYKRSTFKKEFFEMFFGTNHQKTTIANGGILSSIKKLIEYIDSFAKYL